MTTSPSRPAPQVAMLGCEPVKHVLKTWPVYFDAVARGEKTFEVRRNDRGFQTGDIVELRRFHPPGEGFCFDSRAKALVFRIGWILQGGQFGIEPGVCVFSLSPLDSALAIAQGAAPAGGEGSK